MIYAVRGAAREIRVADRIYTSDALDPENPIPAQSLVTGVWVDDDEVYLSIERRSAPVVLPADAEVVVGRDDPLLHPPGSA